jgi:hypothetical protein
LSGKTDNTNLNVERYSVGENVDDSDPNALGTCAASIAYGNIGIMIKGTLVSMKVFDDKGELDISYIFTAFGRAINDITNKKRRGRSVINMGQGKSIIYQMTFVHNNLHIII